MADKEIPVSKSIKNNKSLTTLNPQLIFNNPLNNSSSKMQYSFSKGARFSEDKHRIDTHYYDVPTTLAKRSTSLGYGNKISLAAIDNEIPPPTKYTIRSEFSPDRRTGASFGYGREYVKANSVFKVDSNAAPAPNAYNPTFRDKQLKFSFRQKLQDHSDKWIRQVPGPGSYSYKDPINEQGKNFVSKYQTPPTAKFSILPRLVKEKVPDSPGPAQYDVKKFEKSAKFHSPVGIKFTHSKRKGPIQNNNSSQIPGPGQYSLFSEFLH